MPVYHRYNEETLSNDINEIISYQPHWFIRKGSLIFLVLIIACLSLSWFIQLDNTIVARTISTDKTGPEIQLAVLKTDARHWKPGQQVWVKGQCRQPAGAADIKATIGEVHDMPGIADSIVMELRLDPAANCREPGGISSGVDVVKNERLFYRILRSE